MQQEDQQANEKHEPAVSLLCDNLQDPKKPIQAIKYATVEDQLTERCENAINHLREPYVDHARDPGKDNVIIIAQKHTTSATNKYYDLPCYISRCM